MERGIQENKFPRPLLSRQGDKGQEGPDKSQKNRRGKKKETNPESGTDSDQGYSSTRGAKKEGGRRPRGGGGGGVQKKKRTVEKDLGLETVGGSPYSVRRRVKRNRKKRWKKVETTETFSEEKT